MSLKRENDNTNFREQEQGGELTHGQRDPKDPQFDIPRDDRRMGHYMKPKNTDHNTDCRNVHESYSDITWKVKVEVPSFDGKINAITFSDWPVAMEDNFDWYEMSNVERVRFAKTKFVGCARKF